MSSPIDLDYSLCVTNKIQTNQHETHKYGDFYNILINEYKNNGLFKKGLIFFEYFNAKTFQVKPRFDIDQKLYYVYNNDTGNQIAVSTNMKETELLAYVVKDTLESALYSLYDLFPNTVEEDYAISKDCRWCKDGDGKDYYKISYHICYWKKKIDSITLKKYIEQNMDIFKEHKLHEALDLKIYMSGMTKWRIPFCKKFDYQPSVDNSLLEPMNFTELKDFHKHLVTYVCNCEELKLEIEDKYVTKKNYNKDANDFINQMSDNTNEINSKKNQYTFIGVPKIDNDVEYTDIKEFVCGKNHNHNHNFLIHDIRKNLLCIRCHSAKCEDFSKILHRPKLNYTEFNIPYFNNIPITDGKENNYDECRVYFELFFKFMRDSNSFYRIDNTYDRRLKYYERKIKSIKIEGYGDLLFKERKENSVIHSKFLEKYKHDNQKSAYFDLCFEPYNKNLEKQSVIKDSNFNLFNGFNYESILTYEQRENIPANKYDEFEVLKEHILKYHCSNEPKHFDFLMQFLANIIQTPQFIPQIILVFYSSKHGTGKSNFTRFISEVIGNPLSFFGSLKQITETHTNAHLGKLLNIIEEVDNYSTRQYENIIKDYSQRIIAALNQKNKDIIQIKTFIRYIFTSNHFNGVFFDSEDRRYCVYTFEKILDKVYVDMIQNILKDNYIKYLFGKYLENYDITYHNPNDWNQNRTKTSDYYNMMVEDSLKNFLKEIYANETYYLMEEDHDDFHIDENDSKYILIHHKKFSDLYKEFCKDANERPQKMTNINKQLTSTYKSIFSIKKSGKGSRKFHRIDLFKLGEYLNLKNIENKYNGYKKILTPEEILMEIEEKKYIEENPIIEEILDEKKIN